MTIIKHNHILILPLALFLAACSGGDFKSSTSDQADNDVNWSMIDETDEETLNRFNIVDGDVLEPKEPQTNGVFIPQRAGPELTRGRSYWKNGIIPLKFGSAFTAEERQMVRAACRIWGERSAVRCVNYDRSRHRMDFVRVQKHQIGCYASVGNPADQHGPAVMNLEPRCFSLGIIMHEFGHIIGMSHEQQRADRDKHIRIIWEKVDPNCPVIYALRKRSSNNNLVYLGPYDHKSIMHYHRYRCSLTGEPIIEPIEDLGEYQIGDNMFSGHLSEQDRIFARKVYGN